MNVLKVLSCFLVAFSLFATIGLSIPQQMSLQGRLTNPAGGLLSGSYAFDFGIYDVLTGGTALWTESQVLAVSQGIFTVNLGDITPITLPFDTSYYLEINVSGETLVPRINITSSSYAYRANVTDYCPAASIYDEHWVNETGDTMTGNLIVNANLAVDSTDSVLFVDSIGNKIGIGTITPINPLYVVGTTNLTDDTWLGETSADSIYFKGKSATALDMNSNNINNVAGLI